MCYNPKDATAISKFDFGGHPESKLTRNTISRHDLRVSRGDAFSDPACGNTTDTETENTTAGNDATPDTTTAEVRPDLPERDFWRV